MLSNIPFNAGITFYNDQGKCLFYREIGTTHVVHFSITIDVSLFVELKDTSLWHLPFGFGFVPLCEATKDISLLF